MTQLLDIKCIPIKLDFQTQPMEMQISKTQEVNLEIEREKGGMEIKKNIPKMDKIEISKGPHVVPVRTVKKSEQSVASSSSSVNDDNSTLEMIKQGEGSTQPLKTRSGEDVNLKDVAMEYKMDKIKFNCHRSESKIDFVPGSINYTVSQYPDVEINYTGDMIYVPKSANPNYDGPISEK